MPDTTHVDDPLLFCFETHHIGEDGLHFFKTHEDAKQLRDSVSYGSAGAIRQVALSEAIKWHDEYVKHPNRTNESNDPRALYPEHHLTITAPASV